MFGSAGRADRGGGNSADRIRNRDARVSEAGVSGRAPGLDAARPILDVLAQPVVATDLEYTIIYWNPAATDIYGYSAADAIGKPIISLLGIRDDLPELHDATTRLAQGQPWTGELQTRTRTGVTLTTLLALTPLSINSGDLVAFIGTSVDVTAAVQDRRRLNDALMLVEEKSGELRFQALHDFLTGLPNRALILDRAEQMLARGRRHHIQVAALFVDLDHFKNINDSLGHAAGDELLKAVAVRLAGAVRDSDTVGRLGGDEFVVLAEGDSLDAGSGLVAQRLLDVLREPFTLHTIEGRPTPYPISASIGIADGDRTQAEDLLRDADLALYKSKAAGRNRYTVFETEMQTALQDRLILEADLRAALDAGQFYLDYQPTFNLFDTSTVGVEALLRWAHPTRGTVAPLQFIATLEDTGLIVPVGRWVLTEACRQGAAWHHDGLPLSVSVNVSARQLEAGSFPHDVTTALADSGLPPGALVIEITESILMRDAEATIARLTSLKATGIRIAIDDFGTGYSSLAYLRQFPVDVLKIDQSFVTGVTNSDQGEALLHTLVQLGKRLGLQTVAEGIETRDQLRTLQLQDCDTGQGFLIAKPMTPAAITEYVRANQAPTHTAHAQ
jgi:diguanylate cyclase (GGDEF)-like protein/PAS domain S-box-containing protein